MRHRRGIDLLAPIPPARYHEYEPKPGVYDTVKGLREWEMLGARCGKCGHVAWLDKAAVVKRYSDQYLHSMGSKMVCRCGNAQGNAVLVGTMGRD